MMDSCVYMGLDVNAIGKLDLAENDESNNKNLLYPLVQQINSLIFKN